MVTALEFIFRQFFSDCIRANSLYISIKLLVLGYTFICIKVHVQLYMHLCDMPL